MHAISPYSLVDQMRPERPGTAQGSHGATPPEGGIVESFSDLLDTADINQDGKLNGQDLAGHLLSAGLGIIGDALGLETFTQRPDTAPCATPATPSETALAHRAARSGDPATPPGVAAIQATYGELRAARTGALAAG